jgi:hypothetical protein
VLLLFGLLLANDGKGQVVERAAASDLIRFLTQPEDRLELMGMLRACPGVSKERATAKALVQLGASASSALDEVLDSIERNGERSEFAYNGKWLLYAYAKIKGPAAFPRLKAMISNPTLGFLGAAQDQSIALSLALTSYVSGFHPPDALRMVDGRVFFCRPQEPRDALDQLIAAWESGDRRALEAVLGQNAKITLATLPDSKTWEEMRADIWHGKTSTDVAVGYRFKFSALWSEAEETLEEKSGYSNLTTNARDVALETELKDNSGNDCRTVRVNFTRTAVARSSMYLVDNVDLPDLLRSITFCATRMQ